MAKQVKKTGGVAEFHRLKKEAKELGIDVAKMNTDALIAAIQQKQAGGEESGDKSKAPEVSELDRLTCDAVKLGIDIVVIEDDSSRPMNKEEVVKAIQRKQIADTERIRIEEREKIMQEYRLKQDRADIIAESESLCIPIDLPKVCTELDLAKARRDLGMKKVIPKPSPETLAIEASTKGYYIFRNLVQGDQDISCNVGGKHRFDFIPDELHCLPLYIIKFMRTRAVEPVYERVPVKGQKDGDFGEITMQTGTKPRFTFEFIDEAPQEAEFGPVRDESLKAKLLQKELV